MTKPKRNHLALKTLNFLSLVDNPANQHATSVIAKRAAPAAGMSARKALKSLWALVTGAVPVQKDAVSFNRANASGKLWGITSDLGTSIASILSEEGASDAKAKLIDATLSQARDAILALNTDDAAFDAAAQALDTAQKAAGVCAECGANMGAGEIHKSTCETGKKGPVPADDPANTGLTNGAGQSFVRDEVQKTTDQQPPAAAQPVEDTTMKRTPQTFTDLAAANTHIGVITKQLDDVEVQVETLAAEKDPLAVITKGLPEAAAKLVRDTHSELQSLQKRDADRTRMERVRKMAGQDTGERGAGLNDAEQSALALVLKGIDALPETERKPAEDLLVAAFKNIAALSDELESFEIGSTGAEEEGEGSASTELAQKVAEVRKRADSSKLSDAQVMDIVYKEAPHLYDDDDANHTVAQ